MHEEDHRHEDAEHRADNNAAEQPGQTWQGRAGGLAYTALFLAAAEAVVISLSQGAPEVGVVASQAIILTLGLLVLTMTTE